MGTVQVDVGTENAEVVVDDAATQTPDPVEEINFDDVEDEIERTMLMREAEIAAAGNEEDDQSGEQADPVEEAAPAEEEAPTSEPETQEEEAASPRIPKERFDQVRQRQIDAERRAAEAEAQIAVYKEQLAAQAANALATPQDPPTPKVSPEDRLAEIEDAVDGIFVSVSEASIDGQDAQAQIKALREEARGLRKQMSEDAAKQADAATSETNDLNDHAAALMEKYPALTVVVEDSALLDFVEKKALEIAAKQGKPIGEGLAETKRLRSYMGQLSERLPAEMLGREPQQAKDVPSETAKEAKEAEQRKAKVDLASSMPPDTGKMGSQPGSEGGITESQWHQMSPEEQQDAVAKGVSLSFMS